MKKAFLITQGLILSVVLCFGQTNGKSLMKVNYQSLVQRADLFYDTPVLRSEEGMPVGNGRTGSLVWTTPSAIHFQINRVDVFAMDCNTTSFPDGHINYSNGCGYVDFNMVDYGDDIFSGKSFNQHLSLYNGLMTVKGNGLSARVIAWNEKDIIATEIDDQRDTPSVINVDLRMLRYAINYIENKNWQLTSNHSVEVLSGSHVSTLALAKKEGFHSATSRLEIRNGCILLIQEFREGSFYNASAVAIGILGRKSKAVYYNEATVRLSAEPGKGKFVVMTSSASSFDPGVDVADIAMKNLGEAEPKGFEGLVDSNNKWWSGYWSKSFVRLHSDDNVADEVEKNITYYLYIMASCSRGDYMPGFRGMLWYTNGDLSMWGSQYWWNNQGTYFNGLTPWNRPELLDPVFSTFSRHLDSYALAARQQWGSKGIWIPETTWFNGLEVLPDSIAMEMRELYLALKPWDKRSENFREFAKKKNDLNSRWNFLFLNRSDKGEDSGPFSWTSHIMSSTAKISYLYWLRYAYYPDRKWLRNTGYPMIKGTAEFYRNFPNLFKDKDGKYHIRYINNLESNWGGKDTPEELLAMHVMLPLAIKASEILGIDTDLRSQWKDIIDNLTPVPEALQSAEYYDFCNVGTKDKVLFSKVLELYNSRNGENINQNTDVNVLSRLPVAAASLGKADNIKYLIPAQIRSLKSDNCDYKGSGESGTGVLRNRLMLREGPGAIECERLGLAAQALATALLQSVSPSPGETPVNYIFPAWPREWDAQFTLAAQNNMLISSSIEKGQIEFVEISSKTGGKYLLKNPWPNREVNIICAGKKILNSSGDILVIQIAENEVLSIVPKGSKFKEKMVL